ncbi:hypothetical protein C2S53_016892 [Perilla frutescens var. hirtella]|uniref:Phospholipase-like protein n=1 Tax=Perilla frutescens var. hirtella TaxID=608512 RepID=A0AAD4NWJ4_PERFH|nr:hypothetical protein C2S53_016892 [Perilla frutescens var. hirtella]
MVGASGRKRGRAQETHRTGTDQDIAISRYPKRSSRGVAPQLLPPSSGNPPRTMKCSSGQSRSLKPPLRFLKDGRVIPKPELHNCSLQPAKDPGYENYMDGVKSSASTGSRGHSGPYSQHQINLDDLCAKLVSQVEGPQEVAPQPQDLNADSQPPREDGVVSRVEVMQEKSTTNDVPPSDRFLSPSHSLNVTEFARALRDDSDDDPDEVESASDPSHDIVHGHRVKIEIAPLLRKIFKKYGDITVDTNVKCPSILSFFLERLCAVYQRLEKTKLSDLTHHEINEMLVELQCIESQNINAKWLLEKVEEISEAKTSLKKYLMFKDEVGKCIQSNDSMRKEVVVLQKHIDLIQKKVSTAEELMIANEAKANECTKMALDIKARVKDLLYKPLVHGLL